MKLKNQGEIELWLSARVMNDNLRNASMYNICLFILNLCLVSVVQATPIDNISSLRNVSGSHAKNLRLKQQQEWYVILGTYPQKGYKKAKILSKKFEKRGYKVMVRDSGFYKGLKDELVVVMMGPFHSQKQATTKRNAIKHIIREAYIKKLLYQDAK